MAEPQPPTMAQAATLSFGTLVDPSPPRGLEAPPDVPGYAIVRLIGRGGMGVVYEARDLRLQRTVALKLILLGPHASEKDRARFRQEAEAVARLQHPGIVQIYEIGSSPTGPFLALEYVGGGSLAERIDGKPWVPTSAASLVEQVAIAIEAAHGAGIIHRDLKPANILLTGPALAPDTLAEPTRTSPNAAAEPPRPVDWRSAKITDFGLAKRLDSAQGQTATGAILGTPSYMAPEQAEGKNRDIAPATDVYALGAILYELLTGRPPFLAETPIDTIMQVTRQEPVAPSRLNPKVPRDLETICLKCLRKEADRRYATAALLAADLRRFQEGRPIHARPVGMIERGWRWCQRNPVVAGLLTTVAVLLLEGTGIASYFAIEANRQWKDARASAAAATKNANDAMEARRLAERNLYVARISLAQNALRENRIVRLRELLHETTPAANATDHRGWEWHFLTRQANMDRGLPHALEGTPVLSLGCLHCSLNAKRLAAVLRADGSDECFTAVIDVASGRRVMTHKFSSLSNGSIALSLDGRVVAEQCDGKVRVWDVATGRQIFETTDANLPGGLCVLDAEGQRIGVYTPGAVTVYSVADKSQVAKFAIAADREWVTGLRFNRAGTVLYINRTRMLPAGGGEAEVFAGQLKTGDLKPTTGPIRSDLGMTYPFAVSDDDRWLVCYGGKQRLVVWDINRGQSAGAIVGAIDALNSLAISINGRFVAVGLLNGGLQLYDRGDPSGTPHHLRGHQQHVLRLGFDGLEQLVSVAADGEMRYWDCSRIERVRLPGSNRLFGGLMVQPAFDGAGRYLAQIIATDTAVAGVLNREVLVWDVDGNRAKLRKSIGISPQNFNIFPGAAALSHDGRYAAFTLNRNEEFDRLRAAAGILPGRFGAGGGNLPQAVVGAGVGLIAPETEIARIYDVNTGKLATTIQLSESTQQMLLSTDGKLLFTAGSGWRLHETLNGLERLRADRQAGRLCRGVFSSDGRRLAVGRGVDPFRKLAPAMMMKGPESPEKTTVTVYSLDGGTEIEAPIDPEDASAFIAQIWFSPSGRYLAALAMRVQPLETIRRRSGEFSTRLLVWDLSEPKSIRKAWDLNLSGTPAPLAGAHCIAFREIDDRVAVVLQTGEQAAEVRALALSTGESLRSFRFQAGEMEFAGFSADGRRLITFGAAASVTEFGVGELRVLDLVDGRELLEIHAGNSFRFFGGNTFAFHFDGTRLRIANWNENGGELRTFDGAPLRSGR